MTKSSGLSLATKFILAMVLLLAAAVGTSALYSRLTLHKLAESQAKARRLDGEKAIRTQSEILVRNIATSSSLPMASSDFDQLKELAATTLKENPSLAWIAVIDEASGQYLVNSPDAPQLTDLTRGELHAQLKAEPRTADVQRGPGDDDGFVFASNVFVGKRVVGQVYLMMSNRELREAIAASVAEARAQAGASARNQLLFAALMLLVGILVAVLGSRRIAGPLQQLSMQAGYIAGGDFGQRVVVTSRDEIGVLAQSFNQMAESLGILLHEMAGKASLERELELARGVQQMMSPPPKLLPAGEFSLIGRCEMAVQCGGDWWSYRVLSSGRVLLVVGDVTGHGLPAAMIAATARGAVEALSMVDESSLSPPRLLEAIDRAIRDVGNTQLLMTCFAVLLEPDRGRMTFANAGHTFPYVLRPARPGKDAELNVLAVRGNPLGMGDPKQSIAAGERELLPDEMIVLSSDGLTDRVALTGERFGDKRLRRILIEHQPSGSSDGVVSLSDRIVRDVNEFGGMAPLDDDLTLVICQYNGPRRVRPQRGVA